MNPFIKAFGAVLTLVLVAFGSTSPGLLAQATSNGSIVGKVTDSSGAIMSGVLVTVTSPQLQVPKVTATSDANGDYKVLELPAPGVYSVTFSLQGFQAFKREGLNLTGGFAAKVDAALVVGSVTESVTVTGSSPVVDTVNNAVETTLSREQLTDVPHSVGLQEMLPLAQGVSLNGPPDVGDSNMVSRQAPVTYGIYLTPTLGIEGVNNTAGNENSMQSYMTSSFVQEAEFSTSGNNADVGKAGVFQNVVMKTGSNKFHGTYNANFQPPAFQGNNINATLAAPPQSLVFGSPLTGLGYYDYSGDIGGRILRDKLWFYGGYALQATDVGFVNWIAGPGKTVTTSTFGLKSACWLNCTDAPPGFAISALPTYAGKISYQFKPSINITGSFIAPSKHQNAQGANSLNPMPSDGYQRNPILVYKTEIQVVRTKWLFDGLWGAEYEWAGYNPEPASSVGQFGWTKGTDFAGDPAETENSTGLHTGVDIGGYNQQNDWNRETSDNFTYLPSRPFLGGKHQLKFGMDLRWSIQNYGNRQNLAAGNYFAIFNQGVPYRVQVYNYPFNPHDNEYDKAAYATDTWSLKRVTINIGMRWDRYDAWYPQQTTTTGQFVAVFPITTEPKTQILTWQDFTPRGGATWDVRGNGKTVIKGSYGMFGNYMGYQYPTIFDNNAVRSNTYAWATPTLPALKPTDTFNQAYCGPTDPLAPVQYACDVPASVLSYINSGAAPIISQTGGTSQINNPGLQEPVIHEYVGRIERQLVPNVSVNAGYVGHSLYHLYNASTNGGSNAPTTGYSGTGIGIGHPYSSYTVATAQTDGLTGQPVTVYTYPTCTPAATCNASQVLNTPGNRPDYYHSIEFGVTKRYSKRWNAAGSFWITKNHRWINGLSGLNGSPNDDPFPIDNTWNWELRAYGTYNLPWGFKFTGNFRDKSGAWGQRTQVFTTGLQQSVTRRMGPFGEYQSTTVPLLNISLAKTFRFHDRFKLEPHVQVYNVLNNASVVSQNWQTGASTFGKITSLEAPRVARVGAEFSF